MSAIVSMGKTDRSIRAIAVTAVAFGVLLLGGLVCATGARAAGVWWQLNGVSMPASIAPGASGALRLTATSLGDADVAGQNVPVALRGRLSAGVTATSVVGRVGTLAGDLGLRSPVECSLPSSSSIECAFKGDLPPYEQIEAEVSVQADPGARASETVEMSVSGGETYACEEVSTLSGKYTSSVCSTEGAGNYEKKLSGKPLRTVSATKSLPIGSAPVGFGAESYELKPYSEDGSLDTQAGSHPFDLTTTLALNRTAQAPYQPAMPKDLHFKLPPGLVGNPTPFPQCSDVAFSQKFNFTNKCPVDTAVGVALVSIEVVGLFPLVTAPVPVFNLKPSTGEPARFGFEALDVPVILDTSVRTGGDYGVTVSVNNITQIASFFGSIVSFWGVPGDPKHDTTRGWNCLNGGMWALVAGLSPCAPLGQTTPPPLLSMPTSCTGPLQTSVSVDSWSQKGVFFLTANGSGS